MSLMMSISSSSSTLSSSSRKVPSFGVIILGIGLIKAMPQFVEPIWPWSENRLCIGMNRGNSKPTNVRWSHLWWEFCNLRGDELVQWTKQKERVHPRSFHDMSMYWVLCFLLLFLGSLREWCLYQEGEKVPTLWSKNRLNRKNQLNDSWLKLDGFPYTINCSKKIGAKWSICLKSFALSIMIPPAIALSSMHPLKPWVGFMQRSTLQISIPASVFKRLAIWLLLYSKSIALDSRMSMHTKAQSAAFILCISLGVSSARSKIVLTESFKKPFEMNQGHC